MLCSVTSKPKVRDIVNVKCSQCQKIGKVTFREQIRTVNRQSKYTANYLCPKCYKSLEQYRAAASKKSKAALPKILKGSSKRSKKLWQNQEYVEKNRKAYKKAVSTKGFKESISDGVKKKFQDKKYKHKIIKARKKYWEDEKYRNSRTRNTAEFIDEARSIHKDNYDYNEVDYINCKSKIVIKCSKHGNFTQRPTHHLTYENGCPRCAWEIKASKAQLEIGNWISSEFQLPVEINDRSTINLEIDILIPGQLGIEYHGGFWHSFGEPETKAQKYKHYNKATMAEDAGIQLLQFWDEEWTNKQDIVKSMIRHKLGKTVNRIYASKCKVFAVCPSTARDFFNANHLQAHRTASFYLGLEFDGDLVSMISMSPSKNSHELIRFCNKLNTHVCGGLSRLIAHAPFKSIISYADRRYSDSNGYKTIGFKHTKITKPGYRYWKNNKTFSRIKFQKHKLERILKKYDKNMTESENMFANGYRRIWDAGHHKLTYEN